MKVVEDERLAEIGDDERVLSRGEIGSVVKQDLVLLETHRTMLDIHGL